MVKVILWDIDGTLLNFALAESNALRKCFEIFKLGELSDDMVKTYSRINQSYWKRLERGEMTKKQILVQRYVDFFSLIGVDTSICEDFNEQYLERLGDTVCLCPNAWETVLELKSSGVIQCAVTNGTLELQKKKLRQSGLDGVFDRVFISEEVGFEKPSIEFFDKVMQALGEIGKYSKDEILIVGDSLSSDMQGGMNAGLGTCLYDPQGLFDVASVSQRIDHVVSDLRDVCDLIRRK